MLSRRNQKAALLIQMSTVIMMIDHHHTNMETRPTCWMVLNRVNDQN